MPEWMTSLLRLEVSVPCRGCLSKTTTVLPDRESLSATAKPTTPAPMMVTSTVSIYYQVLF